MALYSAKKVQSNIPDGISGLHPEIYGDFSGILPGSDVSNIYGDLSKMQGLVSANLRGIVSGLEGDISKIFGRVSKKIRNLDKLSKHLTETGKMLDRYNDQVNEEGSPQWKILLEQCKNLFYYGGWLGATNDWTFLRLSGDVSRIEGCVTRIWGILSPGLCGVVTGLVGDITGIEGDATDVIGSPRSIIENQERK